MPSKKNQNFARQSVKLTQIGTPRQLHEQGEYKPSGYFHFSSQKHHVYELITRARTLVWHSDIEEAEIFLPEANLHDWNNEIGLGGKGHRCLFSYPHLNIKLQSEFVSS